MPESSKQLMDCLKLVVLVRNDTQKTEGEILVFIIVQSLPAITETIAAEISCC